MKSVINGLILACLLMVQPAWAEHKTEADWPEKDIIQFLGKPSKVIRQKERGCNEVFYQYQHHGPYMQIEFRCNHVNVGWFTFDDDPKYKKNNELTEAHAKQAIERLTRRTADELLRLKNSTRRPLVKYPVNDELWVSGNCYPGWCILTYSDITPKN